MADGQFSTTTLVATPSDLPPHTPIKIVRPRGHGERVAAALAPANGEIINSDGHSVTYRAGEDYVVEHRTGHRDVVPRDIFERTFKRRKHGFKEDTDIRYRAAIAQQEMHVATREGVKTAREGDWVMIGLKNEMWPVPADVAKRKYKGVPAVGITGVVTTVALVFALLAFVAWYAS